MRRLIYQLAVNKNYVWSFHSGNKRKSRVDVGLPMYSAGQIFLCILFLFLNCPVRLKMLPAIRLSSRQKFNTRSVLFLIYREGGSL